MRRTAAAVVHEAIARLGHKSDGSCNDLDRLEQDLGLEHADRLRLGSLIADRLGHRISDHAVLKSETVADLVVALQRQVHCYE